MHADVHVDELLVLNKTVRITCVTGSTDVFDCSCVHALILGQRERGRCVWSILPVLIGWHEEECIDVYSRGMFIHVYYACVVHMVR